MSISNFRLPDDERRVIWRYLDGVSQALARRFDGGSPPGEENLTFLMCELLDEGTTGLHLLDYPLKQAKEDLAKSDGGITLDLTFETHEHTRHVEHHFSGADLGVIFIVEHPLFGRSEKAVLLQAKRLFPFATNEFRLTSSFNSFHVDQCNLLKEIQRRFAVGSSIFYLWYMPASGAFADNDAKLIRSLEAIDASGWPDLRAWDPLFEDVVEFRGVWFEQQRATIIPTPEEQERERAWRTAQPATRISSLSVVDQLTRRSHAPSLLSLYHTRSSWRRRGRPWRSLIFEPFAELFLFAFQSGRIGHSSKKWLQLARGEKVPMPPSKAGEGEEDIVMPEIVPPPRHSLTFTLRSSLPWPEGFRDSD